MGGKNRLDFAQCLAKFRELESDVYMPLSKSAKALGLVQISHFSYQTDTGKGGNEEVEYLSLADPSPDSRQKVLANMIKKDFHLWNKLLCTGKTSTLDLATMTQCLMTIEAFDKYLLPHKNWNEKTAGIKQPKIYVLE